MAISCYCLSSAAPQVDVCSFFFTVRQFVQALHSLGGKQTTRSIVHARHPVEARDGNNTRTGYFNRATTIVRYLTGLQLQ